MRYRMIVALFSVTLLVGSGAYPDDISDLRARGQAGVDELHARWAAAPPEERPVLQAALDAVCAQKDCHASRLYWYTDFEEAKAAAHRLHRPILSLYLLGHLDEELSCANSRFFRTLLYSDDSISAILREKFVLYWHSVREVPLVTIELGDGRVLRQTITGNSVHYLLSADGEPLDLLPGLYSPAAFRGHLESWLWLVDMLDRVNDTERADALVGYHRRQYIDTGTRAAELNIDRSIYSGQQPVWVAQMQSMSKSATEVPLLRQLKGARAVQPAEAMKAIGDRGKDSIGFSEPALRLMSSKQELTAAVMDRLRRTVAVDTAWNEYDLHRRAHGWFANGQVGDLQSLNERV